ncbi:MAG: YqgE/AlgH family protein [Marinagarivorans sp.]
MPIESSISFGDNLRNHLLIATPSLKDPHFSHTVTYICDHSQEGAMGIVLNRPLDLNIGQVFEELNLPLGERICQAPVLSGGPVNTQRGFVLHNEEGQWDSSLKVTDGICLTGSKDILTALSVGQGPTHALFALGHAGWSAGQLEDELATNAWLTVPASYELLFCTPIELRWSAAAKHLGIDPNLISPQLGHG